MIIGHPLFIEHIFEGPMGGLACVSLSQFKRIHSRTKSPLQIKGVCNTKSLTGLRNKSSGRSAVRKVVCRARIRKHEAHLPLFNPLLAGAIRRRILTEGQFDSDRKTSAKYQNGSSPESSPQRRDSVNQNLKEILPVVEKATSRIRFLTENSRVSLNRDELMSSPQDLPAEQQRSLPNLGSGQRRRVGDKGPSIRKYLTVDSTSKALVNILKGKSLSRADRQARIAAQKRQQRRARKNKGKKGT